MKKLLAMILALTMVLSFAACGGGSDAADDTPKPMVYAVEAGSAGEAVALENGWQVNSVVDQATALLEVASGTSDAAIIDLLMAGAMIGEGTDYPNLTYTDKLTTEEYGVGCRKGSNLVDVINYVLYTSYSDGSMKEIATVYGVQESIVEQPACQLDLDLDGTDIGEICDRGKLVVGITDFAPMDYQDDNGEWIGFDADMARKVADVLGVPVEFQIIDWDMKINELDSKNIDCVWNGMTLTAEVLAAMDCSNPYCNNAQVVVVPAK